MHNKTWFIGIATLALPLALVGLALLTLGHSAPVQAESPTSLIVTQDVETSLSEISAVSASVVQTWTHTTRADWEQGTLEWLDSATVSGSLQLAQRFFGASTTVTPREDLGAGQTSPDIAVDADGNAYSVWSDGRNGHTDIYFAYRAVVSTTWSASVRVNDDTGMAQQGDPSIAVDANSNAYVMWADERNGDADIYFAYRPVGGSWGANVKVNDDAGTAGQSTPAIAIDSSGNSYAVWSDGRNGDDDIYFATRPVGGSWGINIRVNDDPSIARQFWPAIAVDSRGNAYAVWTDQRNGDDYDVYFAYRPVGEDWGNNTRVNDDETTEPQYAPSIAVDASGNAYAIWVDNRNSMELYFSYRPAGGNWGANSLVNADGWGPHHPTIAVDVSGNAYAVWEDHRNNNYDIYFAYRASISTTWSAGIKINDDSGMAQQWYSVIVADANGNVYAVWEDERNGNPDIYFAFYSEGSEWGANTRVDDDVSGAASQYYPDIAVDASGSVYAVWHDRRNGDGDIYFAYRAAVSTTWSADIKVNDDTGTEWQYDPAIAVDAHGNAYAVWRDRRDGDRDTYFAYRPAGGSWENNVKINDDVGTARPWLADIAVDANGNAYAVWIDERNGDYDVYFSYRASISTTWSANVKVNDDTGTELQWAPSIAVDASGNAYATWADYRNGSGWSNSDIYFAYRPSGGSWGANVKVNDDIGTESQLDPAIAIDSSGNAYVVWQDARSGNNDIYFAYRPAGGSWGMNILVNDDSGMAVGQPSPTIAVDSSANVYVLWHDTLTGDYNIYFATRPAGGNWRSNFRVNDEPGMASQFYPAIAVDEIGGVYAMWDDHSYGTSHVRFAHSLDAPEYALEGRYTSPELDTGVTAATWESFTWQSDTPAGTSLAFETRSRIAGGDWSEWEPVYDVIASPPGQYFQYRVTFSTVLTDTTPLLEQVQISYRSVETPSAPRFATPCGVTNQGHPILHGSATAGSVVRVYTDGDFATSTTVENDGSFSVQPSMGTLGTLYLGTHVFTATAENERGAGPASTPLTLTVDPELPYDPINVRAGQWSKDGWLMSVPRDGNGCADPTNDWRIWPRRNQRLRVEVPVSYTTSAAVTVTVGTASITLSEESTGLFAGVFQPPISGGDFVIEVNADGDTTVVDGGSVLIDPDGVVYEASGTISDTIPGVQVTCYYSDTHSGQWLTWDAWTYDQVNPQVTLDDGYYSFYTTPGTYRVVAEKDGYEIYNSPSLAVVDTPVRHNVPLEKVMYEIYLPLVIRNG